MVEDVAALVWSQFHSWCKNQAEQFVSDKLDRALQEHFSSLKDHFIPQVVYLDVLVDIYTTLQREIIYQAGALYNPQAVSQLFRLGVHRSTHMEPQGAGIGVAPRLRASQEGPLVNILIGDEELLRQRGRADHKANGLHGPRYADEYHGEDEELAQKNFANTETTRKEEPKTEAEDEPSEEASLGLE